MTTPREHLINVVTDELHGRCEAEIIEAWNDMCDQVGNGERMIHPMDKFNEYNENLFDTKKPLEIIYALEDYADFDANADYFYGDNKGNRYSTNDPLEDAVDFTELAIAIVDRKITVPSIDMDELEAEQDPTADDIDPAATHYSVDMMRPYKSVDEFPFAVGDTIIFRDNKYPKRKNKAMLMGVVTDEDNNIYITLIGRSFYTEYLFEHFEYYADGKWHIFGMPKEL